MAWQREKFDAGYGALTWPVEFGGAGLPEEFATAFDELEAGYVHPPHHETFSVTLDLVAPTLAQFGQTELRDRLLPRLVRTDVLSCQLFSEPGAGSDLGALATRAERDGDSWVVNGQKTWSSGARFAEWGELVARSDLDVPKHQGMTAFMLEMDSPGVTIRPIRQMSGWLVVQRGVLLRRSHPRFAPPRRGRRGLAGRAHHARIRTRLQRLRPRRQHRRRIVSSSCSPWPDGSTGRATRWCGSGSPTCTPTSGCVSSSRARTLAAVRRRRPPGTVRIDRQAAVDEIDDSDRRRSPPICSDHG